MKNSLSAILFTFCSITSASDFYISSAGNDTLNNGLSSSTPWRTIAKVNSVLSTLKPGDRILFNKGDTFYGTLKISSSGIAGRPITVGSYGTGADPVISGFTTISTWIDYGNGIYRSPLTSSLTINMVTLNGIPQPLGRYPNTGYLTFESHVTNISITDNELSDSPDWTGGEVVIRKSPYALFRNKITKHSANTITYTTTSFSDLNDGYGYFIQKNINTLDVPGEWYHDGNYIYMYFGDKDPDSFTVKASTNENLLYIYGRSYINIENISFQGANSAAILVSNYKNISIEKCSIECSGKSAIMWIDSKYSSYNLKINNCFINNSLECAIDLNGSCTKSTISNNTIKNSGLLPGMGNGLFGAIYSIGAKGCYEYNVIENVGRNGIWFHGDSSLVKNNFIRNFCLVLEDAAAIYLSDWSLTYGKQIIGNIILNGIGNREGIPNNYKETEGIYLDYGTKNVKIAGNTVSGCKDGGIKLHGASNIIVEDNTCFNNSYQSWILQSNSNYPVKNLTINRNIFFSKDFKQTSLIFKSSSDNLASFGAANYNYYARPVDDDEVIITNTPATGSKYRTLADWQSVTGQDRNSRRSPITITDTSNIDFYYNATKSDRIISLVKPMIDITGRKYVNNITLTPFTSIILMVDPAPAQPVVPVYVSSAIQNAAPSLLEMTYNVNLDTDLPDPNAFSVNVNDIGRSVTAVSVSGSKVRLTLASPVKYADKISVSYTQPTDINKRLQTPSGGYAVSISLQPAGNNLPDLSIQNDPPVINLTYAPTSYSGIVYELDASGTSDINNDVLTFDWTVPADIPVSSSSGSKIRFLAPATITSMNFDILLNVNDGRVTVSKKITINIMPYKPEVDEVKITSIETSDYQAPDNAKNAADGILSTKWSVNGEDQWLVFKLAVPSKISHLELAFLPDQKYESYFEISASKDNLHWEPILINSASCNFSGNQQVFDFPSLKSNTEYLYLKFVGLGNSVNTWNNISEFKIFGYPSQNRGSGDTEKRNIVIYPNPAKDFFNIFMKEPILVPDEIILIDFSGKIVFRDYLEPEIKNIQIPKYLNTGIYIVQFRSGNLTLDAQKLMVNR